MKLYGLKPDEIEKIKKLFQVHFGDLSDAKIYLFGSRATGQYKPFSDIDIAVKSKAKNLNEKIALFQEEWEKSNLPYKADISAWNELYRPYLPKIRKQKIPFWEPDEKKLHPWRICPYGKQWVVRHPRYPVGRQLQDVDGHCRKIPSGKDLLQGDEIEFISRISSFQETQPRPSNYAGKEKIANADDFDIYIAGWCKYWNDIFKPDIPISSNFIKALVHSESTFNTLAYAKNKKELGGPARGLVQITEQTLKILKDKKGEIKDHYVDLKNEELFEPSKNICAAIRWMFRKREILQKRLSRSPSWLETITEYKGLGRQLKSNSPKAIQVMKNFQTVLAVYQK